MTSRKKRRGSFVGNNDDFVFDELPQPHRSPDDDLRLPVIVIFTGLDGTVLRVAFAAAEGQGLDGAAGIDEMDDIARHELAEMAALPAGRSL